MRRIAFFVVLAALLGGGYWGLQWSNRPVVELVAPQRGHAVRAIYATGVVEPENWAAVAPLEGGRITNIRAFENDAVDAGQALAELDDQEADAVIEELEARKSFLEKEVARNQKLLERSFISEKAYDQAISDYREILAAIAGAKVRRDHLTLRAPIPGRVLRRDGEVGEVVERGQPVFWVGAPRPLQIEAVVDEEDIPLVEVGQVVKIKADAFPGAVLDGQVSDITPKGDPVNKSFRVHIALPDDTPLMIGMTTETNIVVEVHEDALLLPSGAIVAGRVWTVADGKAVPIDIETGIAGHLETEVLAGLDADTRVIAAPPDGLKPGARVRVAASARPQEAD